MGSKTVGAICAAGVLSAAMLACGGSDDGVPVGGSGAGGGGSYADISASLSKPSGKLASSNAVSVAETYEKSANFGATVDDDHLKQVKQVGGASSQTCPAGGTQSSQTRGITEDSIHVEVSFNKCCQSQGCCLDGAQDVYVSTSAEYQSCTAYDVTATCSGKSQKLALQGCIKDGGWVYLIAVDGKSYAVSGNYSNGTGALTIKDASATWTCTYQSNKGSCTGGSATISY